MIMLRLSFMATNRRGTITCRSVSSPMTESDCDSDPVSMDLTMEDMKVNEYEFTEATHAGEVSLIFFILNYILLLKGQY